ncbi:hypothetical protein C0Q70_10538 [Pomacea canaliculata]|uniref:Uncharacterized protein n=1 Tax=Pomacea canaliculata TaxID=400727 RepID=A0A2T7P3F7_POMCA|nr:hypothetical protein C0Q70_10538 [Pomacea canaliculata]
MSERELCGGWVSQELRLLSGCISLVIGVERCVCVLLPLRAVSLISSRTMGLLLCSVYVITQLGFVTSLMSFQVIAVLDSKTSKVLYWTTAPTDALKNYRSLFNIIQRVLLETSSRYRAVLQTLCCSNSHDKQKSLNCDTTGRLTGIDQLSAC